MTITSNEIKDIAEEIAFDIKNHLSTLHQSSNLIVLEGAKNELVRATQELASICKMFFPKDSDYRAEVISKMYVKIMEQRDKAYKLLARLGWNELDGFEAAEKLVETFVGVKTVNKYEDNSLTEDHKD